MPNSRHALKYCGLVILLTLFSGCATVDQWLPQTEEVAATPAAEPTPEPITVDRFRASIQPLSAQQKAWLGTLKTQLANNDNSGVSATIEVIAASLNISETQPSMLFVALGDGAQHIGQQAQAADYWQQAIDSNTDNYYAHDRLATHYRTIGDFNLAKNHYRQALSAWPGFANAYRNRGILFDLYMGDKAAALNDYARYKQLLEQGGQPTKEVDRWIREMQRALEQNF